MQIKGSIKSITYHNPQNGFTVMRLNDIESKKIARPTERPMNTAVIILRAIQVGLSLADLDYLDYGELVDILTESSNDQEEYPEVATQNDYDQF